MRGLPLLLFLALFPAPGECQVSGNSGEATPPVAEVVDPEALPRPSAEALRTVLPVTIDGRLDDEAWAHAEAISGFVQSMPNAGALATEQTVVRVLFDEKNLYIGAFMEDSNPQEILHQYLEQDFETHNEDVFAVTLDTFLDRRNSFMFLFNPNGAVKDGQTFDNSRSINLAWEGVIHVETSIHSEGWTAEIAIPFTTLRFDPGKGEQSWGMNFLRRVRRKNEDSYWAPVDRRSRVHSMAYAGTVEGFAGLPKPKNLTLKPFALGSTLSGQRFSPNEEDQEFDGGLDLKYGVTPRLTLDLTYRTDFSQVEVDQEQVNLTRFSLFFPEKRDFFLENSGIFAFGDVAERNYRMGTSPRDFTLFHSRRIGLKGGSPVPIVGGGRLTGQIGGFEAGLLNMQTRTHEGLPGESFSVFRLRRTFGGALQLGGLFANRDELGSAGEGYNRSYGLDANLNVGNNLRFHSYLSATDYPGRKGNNRAGRISVAYRDQLWDASAQFREVGDAFDPGLGFVARRAIRHTYGTVGAHPRPDLSWLNEVNPYLELHYITDLGGSVETREGTGGFGVVFQDGGRLDTSVSDHFEAIREPFLVAGQGEITQGQYDFRQASLAYTSSAARPLSGTIRISGGGFYHGDRRSVTMRGIWRPSRFVGLDIQAQRNQIDLPGEKFTADVFGGRLELAASRHLFLSSFFQYNAASEEAVTNIRLNFIHSPLSDVFLVFSERRDLDARVVLERGFTIKATKLLSF